MLMYNQETGFCTCFYVVESSVVESSVVETEPCCRARADYPW